MLNSYLAKKIFVAATRIRKEDIDKHLVELNHTQWFQTDKLLDIQWEKLKKILFHCYKNVPFYKNKFDIYGVTPGDIRTPDDINKIPILTKDDLRKSYKELTVTNGNYKYSVAKSSGSTAKPIKFYKDRNASGYGLAAQYRGHSWYGVDVADREARLSGVHKSKKDLILSK